MDKIMKKYLVFATAIAALVSCSSDDFVGEVSPSPAGQESNAIVFGSGVNAVTRANYTGAEAATKLNNSFVVEGTKGASSIATTVVFDNYNVNYTANTANTTESNSNNWEYVGLTANPLTTITGAGTQTIKYWDYSQDQYDFIAYSLGTGGATATTITPNTATSSTGGAYTLAGTTAQLKTVHIADLKTVLKADYNKPVELSFRSLVAKVRMGIYETVPGYSVKDVKFYTSDDAISGGSNSTTAALYASSNVLPTQGTYTVYFPTVNDGTPTTDKNKAHVAFTTSTATQTNQTFGTMATDKLVGRERLEYNTDETKDLLGRSSNASTFAGSASDNYYVEVLPLETGTSLTLKVDYTLISIDGTGETIKVVGAKAVVPAIYTQWKPGYAYTYLFKISDNTNGYTSGVESSELSGLHAITFDAVVEESTEHIQETVTTVATPSITTYQHDPAVNASANNEYKTGDIYAMVMDGGTLKADLNGIAGTKDAAKFYSLSNTFATEADVMDALLMQSSESSGTITGRNALVLTPATIVNNITAIPGVDGNDITVNEGEASKLSPSEAGTYAYVYTATQSSSTEDKYEVVPVTVGETVVTGYYIKSGDDYSEVTTADTKAADETTYYAKYTVNNGTYAVKVIKVVSGS